ncbi:unnamed protein product [Mesocestoides corti]|uniref:AH domain-containing protein n=2 Tax=Mesocestoides corti TaxID=53468 RepID=A0A158QUS9_MESCO|nr:unnamed protein product [Mesocestoides corti]
MSDLSWWDTIPTQFLTLVMSVVGEASTESSLPHSPVESRRDNDSINVPVKNQKGFLNNGSLDLPAKIENFKSWSTTAMKCTKQVIEEKLGTTSPTRDPHIEANIEEIKKMQTQYQEISNSVKKIASHLSAFSLLEQGLSSQLTIAGQSQPELFQEFARNADSQRIAAKSSSGYVAALESFYGGLDTFCKKTVPDTLDTIRQLEHSRLIYDAYRIELERMGNKGVKAAQMPSTGSSDAPTATTADEAPTLQQDLNAQQLRQKFETSRENYLKMKSDADVKMKLLHENRVRVLRNHLQMLQAATFSYYSNGFRNLESLLSSLGEHNTSPSKCIDPSSSIVSGGVPAPSFLEVQSPPVYASSTHSSTSNGDVDIKRQQDEQHDVFQE